MAEKSEVQPWPRRNASASSTAAPGRSRTAVFGVISMMSKVPVSNSDSDATSPEKWCSKPVALTSMACSAISLGGSGSYPASTWLKSCDTSDASPPPTSPGNASCQRS
jgi:hypothetical protein